LSTYTPTGFIVPENILLQAMTVLHVSLIVGGVFALFVIIALAVKLYAKITR